MELKKLLVNESMTLNEIMKRIEKYRYKILYVVENRKLKAAISDGDIRRYLINGGSLEHSICYVANYNPVFIYENQVKNANNIMHEKRVGSIPVLNFNNEVVSILFSNNIKIEAEEKINVPIVIMAGGLGTRLYPYTKILPKPLIPIGDTPITEHIINKFKKIGCEEFYLIVNHKKNMIKAYFDYIDKNYELNYIDEETPLGTGGGLALLKGRIKTDFFFSNCDIIIDSNYIDIYNYHKESENLITIVSALKHTSVPYGVINVNNEGSYEGIIEKPEYKFLINTGLYIVNPKILNDLEMNRNVGFPDIIEEYRIKGEKIGVYSIEEKAFMDMGQLEELEAIKKLMEV